MYISFAEYMNNTLNSPSALAVDDADDGIEKKLTLSLVDNLASLRKSFTLFSLTLHKLLISCDYARHTRTRIVPI